MPTDTTSGSVSAASGTGAGVHDALEYRVYRSMADARTIGEEWNSLAVRCGDILSSFDYCDLWWKHFGQWRSLEVHALRASGRLVAILPLFRETLRYGGMALRTVRAVGCDYTITTVTLPIEPAYAEHFAHMLLEYLDQGAAWDILQLAPVRCYCDVLEPFAKACIEDRRVQTTIIGRRDGWDTLFDLPHTYDTFLAGLSANARNDTRRRERRLRERHHITVEPALQQDEVAAAMDALIELHQQRWNANGCPGQFQRESVRLFHRELADRLRRTGQLVLLTLKADGQIVAATYGYHFGQRTHGLARGHCNEPKWQEYSLGRVLHCHLIRHAIEHGSTVLEDGRGVFDYKLRLGGQLHPGRSLVVVRHGMSSRIRFCLALRACYAINILYSRLWIDIVAPRLGLIPKGRHFHQRTWVLAQLYRRLRVGQQREPGVVEIG